MSVPEAKARKIFVQISEQNTQDTIILQSTVPFGATEIMQKLSVVSPCLVRCTE